MLRRRTFTGYDGSLSCPEAKVLGICVGDGEHRLAIRRRRGRALWCLDQTPFYAEMGGQAADEGTISRGRAASLTVTDVQKDKGGQVPAPRRDDAPAP